MENESTEKDTSLIRFLICGEGLKLAVLILMIVKKSSLIKYLIGAEIVKLILLLFAGIAMAVLVKLNDTEKG